MAQLVLANILAGSGNVLAGGDNSGNVTKVTIGTNLTLVSGVLSATGGGSGSVTSVAMTVPTGLTIAGSPITSSGTLALTYSAGYSIPTTVKQSNWDDAYTWVTGFPTQTGNSGKFLTTNGTTLSWASVSSPVTSVFGRTGAVILLSSDVTGALGYTPYDSSNPSGYVTSSFTNATYLKISDASATYLPLSGGTMTGNLYFPNNGNGIIWGVNYSKIYDNSNLHIYTDDVTYFESNSGSGPFYWRTGVSSSGSGGTTRMTLSGADLSVTGNVTASGFFKIGGASNEFLKADGSVDSTNYASTGYVNATFLTTSAASSTYLPLSGGTMSGQLNGTTAYFTGYVRQINYIFTNTSSYTLVSTDVSKNILMNSSSSNTVTIPNDSSLNFTIGTEINIFQYGTGSTSIVGAGGVSLRSRLNLTKIGGQYSGVTLMKTGSNEWLIVGSLTS